MSHQPSPGPSLGRMHDGTLYHPPGLANNPQFIQKQKNKNYVAGITAGVEDVKYQAKYKELKRKVKEIEADNDKLYFKLLLAKKNIRRMNLERAILYERLAAVPPTPGRHVQELPPDQDPIFHSHPPQPPEHARFIDANDPALAEYLRTRPEARLVLGPDARVIAVEDTPPATVHGAQPVAPQPPPHGLPLVYGFRHDSGPGYDPNRQLPPLPPMIPLMHPAVEPHDLPPINDHHGMLPYPQPQLHGHPHAYSQSHGGSSHHSRSNSARPDLDSLPGTTARIDSLQPMHAGHGHSPGIPGEGHLDRSRRHDVVDQHGHQLPHPHVQIPAQNLPASPPAYSPASTRGSDRSTGRIHNHQRVGPGANINRDVRDVSQREWEQERIWEREHEREFSGRLRSELHESTREWARDSAEHGAPRMSHSASRSSTPPSAQGNGGSRVPSRPSSGQAMVYDVERSRAKAARVSNLLGIDREPGYDEREDYGPAHAAARGGAAEMPLGSSDPRGRYRGDVDVDDDYDRKMRSPGDSSRVSAGQGSALPRGTKRRHPEDMDEDTDLAERRPERMDEDE